MKLGYSTEILDVIVPSKLGGYGVERYAGNYENNLEVNCITIQKNYEYFHFVSVDVLAIDYEILEAVKAKFNQDHHVVISATHTHSGPAGLWNIENTVLGSCAYFLGNKNLEQCALLVDACVLAITNSMTTLQNFNYAVKNIEIEGIAGNRNRPDELGDSRCLLLDFKLDDGKRVALIEYACHPTVLNAESTELDPDLFGCIRNQLKVTYETVLMLNGSAGDISTRYTKTASSKSEMNRLASLFVSQIPRDGFDYRAMDVITFEEKYFKTKLKEPQAVKDLDAELGRINRNASKDDEKILTMKRTAITSEKEYTRYYSGLSESDIAITFIQIDDMNLVFLPLEFTSELSNQIKEKFPNVYIVSYTNGYMMYMAASLSYDLFEYEGSNTSFVKGTGEAMVSYLNEYFTQ